MPLQATSGAASYDAFGGGVPVEPVYIEQIFSTWLYTGNGSTQTITNGIDLAGKGGLLWLKARSTTGEHALFDTIRGTGTLLSTDGTREARPETGLASFNADGFSFANAGSTVAINFNGRTFSSWTFREQPKFFDVVTWTGDASGNRTLSHTLASTPGCIMIKATNAVDDWYVYHRSLGTNKWLYLNNANSENTGSIVTAVSDTTFTVSQSNGFNTNGRTYVAYLFAHNAGGFGLTGTDNVISCGSFTTDGSGNATVTLGYEPQYIMFKRTDSTGNWEIYDTMRRWDMTDDEYLRANLSSAAGLTGQINRNPTATGFQITAINASATFIYIAIRRGPMRTPTSGTSVFSPTLATFSGTSVTNTGFVVDMVINKTGVATTANNFVLDRLRGSDNGTNQQTLPSTSSTSAEVASSGRVAFTGSVTIQNGFLQQNTTANNIVWAFRRAPGYFDEVCYTGDGTANRAITHNLTATPQLILAKSRSNVANWVAYNAFGNGLILNSTAAANSGFNFIASANATTFTPADPASFGGSPNQSGQTYVAYLFASCPGVSRVGSYTGTGATQVINCGFTAGSRFVLIKSTSTTGDWYVWDSARGIVAGNDPYLALNNTNAEVTNTDWVDTAASGFELSNAGGNLANSNGVSYLFFAVA